MLIRNRYVFYNGLSVYLSSMEFVISTHTMLNVVTTESTNTMNVSMNMIGKDIFGQIGSLMVINKISKHSDKNPDTFLKYSVALEQSSLLLESLTDRKSVV